MDTTRLQKRYVSARSNLIFIVALTLINIVILATGGDSYFLFSASIPYIITVTTMLLCGMLPPEFYEGLDMVEFLDPSVFYVGLVISAIIIVFYFLCWIFSGKNRGGWLVAALMAFILDTVFMFFYYGLDTSMIVDFALHIYVIVSFISGISANKKLKKAGEI